MPEQKNHLTVGDVARRSGLAVSAIHFYERKGLIFADRTGGNQRRYGRDVLRRLALIRAAQEVGLPLSEVAEALSALPQKRTPTPQDWREIATRWAERLDQRIRILEGLRHDLDGCIGCGCLSLQRCQLVNPADRLGEEGTGAVTFAR
ncbi:MAG: redox-sensitive transcriptional activator SoxR [Rhizobium sp.]|uniref:redox-sensitive transcriptional activator SoxR n=1 Tax=Rhizobium/Agrobacterium group TaxID=227290 RepID=UPI00129A6E3F|nr:redox-sensitive transcriptional activator SoxR [Agrobacterium sp. MA01]MDM7978808.1 redox-sensitive transcriptional activator SoxR [Rhizobium sp.]MDM8013615.1 redox-sensitive transcriptional activator SoxR [Rhizobium sp.]QGG89635.1 redox-sensitive transcriptional activator SoxR [Agrobacterium sp. MA01]